MMQKPPLIAFDMDGTLLNTTEDIAKAANDARVELGLPPLATKDVIKAVGDGVNLFVSRVTYPETHPEFSRARKIFLKHYALNVTGKTKPYPGIESLILNLKQANIPMAIISNKPWKLVDELVKHFKWESYFGCWLGGDSAANAKPATDLIWLAFDKMNLDRNHPAVLVGDGHQDIMAAGNANIDCLWCSWGFNVAPLDGWAYHIVHSTSDIANYLNAKYHLKLS
ncbi:MAG: HAD hydrolase-like protein [Proteobacteria bacterium]|nr:HAD hydrolase-like protein [Pseudomonadota bacterium]